MVSYTVWNLVKLRHLYIKSGESGENCIEESYLLQMTEQDGDGNKLNSLQTLSQVCPQSCRNIFSRKPNLRKLWFCGPLMSSLASETYVIQYWHGLGTDMDPHESDLLKLGGHSCIGEKWGTSNKKFDTLKILKLHDSELEQWDGEREAIS